MRKNHMKSNARMRLVTIMVALVIGSNAWAQTTVTGSFDTNRISYAAGDETVKSLVAQAYTDVPDMLVWFEVAEGQAVKVDFSASISAQSEDPLLVRMVFDENPSLLIVPAKITIRPKEKLTHYTATFLLPVENGLGPGGHNVRIQWRSSDGRSVVSAHRTLVVQHN
jgi:hypothetical protein